MPGSNVLVLGASYGALFGSKLLMADNSVRLVCRAEDVDMFNREGTRVRIPVRGKETIELDSRQLPGRLTASSPAEVDPEEFDIAVLAMQEPQYGAPDLRALLGRLASAGVPCLSIMNMPPLTYLSRLARVDADGCRSSYTDPEVWDCFEPDLVSLCSPDPQAYRPSKDRKNLLVVGLPTNFKAAPFASEHHNAVLRSLEADIENARYRMGDEDIEVPVKLRVHDSLFVPLAKWAMLIAGNYRCVNPDGSARPIKEAVHGDISATRDVYEWVVDVCVTLGADRGTLVPFEKYAAAASSLTNPSSVARAIAAGAPQVERVDRLVQAVAAQHGAQCDVLDEVVRNVDAAMDRNYAVV